MDVIVTNLLGTSVDAKFVRDVVIQALRLQGYREPPDVGVALVDDAYIRVLNREYRGGDYATDVLAFPMDVAGAGRGRHGDRGGANGPVLGDIVISIQRARDQARQFKQPLRREVALLAIHGLLHLLGYDDETDAAASVMWSRQKELLEMILGARPREAAKAAGGPAKTGREAAKRPARGGR
ncbi:MAG TPA: rRNA maturation RNase YbeY [bacterium]|nr:rRNA maturation RNase YbeY [bacterium]